MVFSSNVFLLYFMPGFFLLYFLLPKKARNYALLFASLLFYAWGAPDFLIQLVVSTIANFYLVKAMVAAKETENASLSKLLCGLSIAIPIGLLVFYKYANFFTENLFWLLGRLGYSQFSVFRSPFSKILLPIGISFFSFQSVTYTLDTYRGVNQPMKKLSDYMLYITMFPQLIAGPIVRYCDVADQIRHRESGYADRLQGFYRFVIGLCKKILIADVIGMEVDAILGPANLSALSAERLATLTERIAMLDSTTAWMVALAYTFQIYFDFAGYSDMAIGLGRIMGFKFPENFNNPYVSKSITEFWRRWHITLGAFIKNYLYLPLGGNRKGKARTYLNLWICFLLSGLWHGASWNFVVWGALHGLFICLDKIFNGKRNPEGLTDRMGGKTENGKFSVLRSPFSVLLTFLFVTVTWMVFRIEKLDLAWTFIGRMFAFQFAPLPFSLNPRFYVTLLLAAIFSFVTLTKAGRKLQDSVYNHEFTDRQHIFVWILSMAAFLFCIAALNASRFSPFIYFRF